MSEYIEGHTEELIDQIPEEHKQPKIQVSIRISTEILAKCAILAKKYNLPIPGIKTPDGKYIYHRFVRMIFFTLLDSYFTPRGDKEPMCLPPLSGEEINNLIYMLNEGRLDEPVPVSLSNETGPSIRETIDDAQLDEFVKGMDKL